MNQTAIEWNFQVEMFNKMIAYVIVKDFQAILKTLLLFNQVIVAWCCTCRWFAIRSASLCPFSFIIILLQLIVKSGKYKQINKKNCKPLDNQTDQLIEIIRLNYLIICYTLFVPENDSMDSLSMWNSKIYKRRNSVFNKLLWNWIEFV